MLNIEPPRCSKIANDFWVGWAALLEWAAFFLPELCLIMADDGASIVIVDMLGCCAIAKAEDLSVVIRLSILVLSGIYPMFIAC